jgi:predicted molibdopterin-dependent oxidoreductase YjgC
VKSLDTSIPKNYVEIHLTDVKKLKIKDGEKVRVTTRHGSIELEARIADKPKQEVFISFHFREVAANVLINPVYGPIAKIHEFKVAPCRVEKIKKNKKEQRILADIP